MIDVNAAMEGEPATVLAFAEAQRLALGGSRDPERQVDLGQFLTPTRVAQRMAALVDELPSTLRLLDAGAGVGSLTAALCDEVLRRSGPMEALHVTAYEVEPAFQGALLQTLRACGAALAERGVAFHSEPRLDDFLKDAVAQLKGQAPERRFNFAIVNPPYRKLRSGSPERRALRSVDIEANNLYSAFLALIIKLLEPGGALCAITPRSFCNGPYFLPFRRLLLSQMQLRDVLVFDSRDRAFADDQVLQETLIWVAYKGSRRDAEVRLHRSAGPESAPAPPRVLPHDVVAPPDDPQRFLYLPLEEPDPLERALQRLPATLTALGLQVATGRVVDFRAAEHLRAQHQQGTAPLLYPAHLTAAGGVAWPRPAFRKPQHLVASVATAPLLLPAAPLVLIKRFSSKEQRRRLMAAVYDPAQLGASAVAVENHLNVFSGAALTLDMAYGLCAFLNAGCVDRHFRVFSGHTQVNATDLRSLRYPDAATLTLLGQRARAVGAPLPAPEVLDALVAQALLAQPAPLSRAR